MKCNSNSIKRNIHYSFIQNIIYFFHKSIQLRVGTPKITQIYNYESIFMIFLKYVLCIVMHRKETNKKKENEKKMKKMCKKRFYLV